MAVQSHQADEQHCMLSNMESSSFERSTNYDIVCIGFGTKALALATALADRDQTQRILILERRSQFDPDLTSVSRINAVRSVFLRDLITFQNPRSEYTFINFLHSKGLLIGFTNVSQMRPSHLLVREYLAWVAQKICRLEWAVFNSEATRVDTVKSNRGTVDRWSVEFRDCRTGALSTITSKRVVAATGSPSHLPELLTEPALLPFLMPLRDSANLLEKVNNAEQPLNIALLGADQRAVELMECLHSTPGQHQMTMIFPGSALRVEDGTPFTQESVDGAGSTLRHFPPEIRQRLLATSVSSKYPTVQLETLESLYASLYAQNVKQADRSKHRFRLQPLSNITSTVESGGKVQLISENTWTGATSPVPGIFDVVVADYSPEASTREEMLAPIMGLIDGDEFSVDRHYKLNLRRGVVARDCGLWLLGSLTYCDTRRDDMTILAQVANRTLKSILSTASYEEAQEGEPTAIARL